MKKKLIEKYILNPEGKLTDYGLMLLARKEEEALIGLQIDMGNEVENLVRNTLERCGYAYYKNSCHADEVRQRLYVRMFGIYCEKFKIERYIGADGFYVENWRTMDREKLLLEYVKYLKERPERM